MWTHADHEHRFNYDIMSQIRDATSSPSTLAEFLQDPAVITTLTSSATKKKSKTRRRPSTSPHGSNSTSMVGMVLAEEERQASHLKALLKSTGDRLQQEIERADKAERRLEHAETRATELRSKVSIAEVGQHTAELQSNRLKEEMRRLQTHIDTVRREFRRAQDDVDALERKRAAAEQSAHKSRDAVRKFQVVINDYKSREVEMEVAMRTEIQKWYDVGRQEGWDAGHDDGFEEGREEGYRDGKISGLIEGRNAGRSRDWEQGREQGRKEEREYALKSFDKFLQEEMDVRRYHEVHRSCLFSILYID